MSACERRRNIDEIRDVIDGSRESDLKTVEWAIKFFEKHKDVFLAKVVDDKVEGCVLEIGFVGYKIVLPLKDNEFDDLLAYVKNE